jgi:CSLREA domain-containing protein
MNTHIIRYLFGATFALMIALLLLVLPTPVTSAPLVTHKEVLVNTTTDEFDSSPNSTCSLREAIKTFNDGVEFGGCAFVPAVGSSPPTIILPSNTYTLTLTGADEDLDATGDLDVRNSVIISATGATMPIVVGGATWTDRIFHILTGTVTIKHIAIRGGHANPADFLGGGAVLIGTGTSFVLSDSEVANNSVGTGGGGISNYQGTLTLDNVTLSGNMATAGGAIYNELGTMTLTNVTLSNNSATGAPGGGGVLTNGSARLINVTFSNNSATVSTYGGGIAIGFGLTTLTNTIVANSPSGGNCSAFIGSIGGSSNLSSDGTCGFGAGRVNVDVMLAPLGNYGGATLTHMLKPGSPAINSGTNEGCPSTDQRGLPRPVNGICDIGAVERQLVDFSYWLNLPLILR